MITTFFYYKSMEIFSDAQRQLTPQSLVRSGRISNSFEKLYISLLPASMKTIRPKMKAPECSQHFPIITLWKLSVANGSCPLLWKPEFQSDLAQNIMQPFPNQNDASDKIWLRWSQRYLCLKMWTHRLTD